MNLSKHDLYPNAVLAVSSMHSCLSAEGLVLHIMCRSAALCCQAQNTQRSQGLTNKHICMEGACPPKHCSVFKICSLFREQLNSHCWERLRTLNRAGVSSLNIPSDVAGSGFQNLAGSVVDNSLRQPNPTGNHQAAIPAKSQKPTC